MLLVSLTVQIVTWAAYQSLCVLLPRVLCPTESTWNNDEGRLGNMDRRQRRHLAAAANRRRIAAHDALCLPIIRECSQYRWPLSDIAAELNRRGIEPPRKGGKWSRNGGAANSQTPRYFLKVEDCLIFRSGFLFQWRPGKFTAYKMSESIFRNYIECYPTLPRWLPLSLDAPLLHLVFVFRSQYQRY